MQIILFLENYLQTGNRQVIICSGELGEVWKQPRPTAPLPLLQSLGLIVFFFVFYIRLKRERGVLRDVIQEALTLHPHNGWCRSHRVVAFDCI